MKMKDYIMSPFFSIDNNTLRYLKEVEICKLPIEQEVRTKILFDEGVLFYRSKDIKKSSSIIVLEPHPDDFALSALGYVEDEKAMILNVFSKMNLDSFTWKENVKITEEQYENIRINEDKFAIEKVLGDEYVSLKEKSMRITDKSVEYITHRIIKKLEEIINKNHNIKTLMIPMGVGGHPDHLVIYNTIMNNYINIIRKKIKVILYPEYPYSRCKKFYLNRLQEIQKKYKIKIILKDVENKLDRIVNAASVYKSQFDDINKIQMLAIIREDCRAIAEEYDKDNLSLVYYEIER